jgi:taurine dioxygenase
VGAREQIQVTPLTPTIGAVVEGVDATAPLPSEQRHAIRAALLEHLVLFFRDQDVNEEQQLAFASNFGPPVSSSLREGDEMLFVTLEDTADSPPQSDRWHTDIPFVEQPPDIAVLSMRVAPAVGGDTMWCSLYAAYEALSPTLRDRVAGLELELDLGTSAEAIRRTYGQAHYEDVMRRFSTVRQPLVRRHPETGKAALYLCGSFMRGIVGMQPDESAMLLGLLQSKLHDPNLQVRWQWRENDLAMWDERCTNHRGLSDHFPQHRVVRRCLVGQGKPVSVG